DLRGGQGKEGKGLRLLPSFSPSFFVLLLKGLSMSSSLLCLLFLLGSASSLLEDAPLSPSDSQLPEDLRQKIVETCNFPSEKMTPDQYDLCTRLVALYRLQLLNEDREMGVQKRKASFIRFGKRSSSLEEEMDTPQKRKASFIRFGRR
ncbi:hypothetical protein PMAYCL1PPCAC_18466, partial [Pristionchus mayeri]